MKDGSFADIFSVNYADVNLVQLPDKSWKTITDGLCPDGRVRMEQLVNFVESGRMDPGLLISHRFNGLEKVEEALTYERQATRLD